MEKENARIRTKLKNEIIKFSQFFFDFWPYKYQEQFLLTCCKQKRVAALWCRQSGKSTSISIYAAYKCLTENNYCLIIISPSQRQSSELYIKIRKLIERTGDWSRWVISSSQTEISFDNGSRIVSLPCGPEGITIKGFTANTIILEE